jgi:uncharacterized membrane protein YgcG
MRCPACLSSAFEHDPVCSGCGLSLEALAQKMGIPPVLSVPVADLADVLSSRERRQVRQDVLDMKRHFPQVSVAVVLMDLPLEMPLRVQAFWLFNRGGLFSAVEKGGENHGVLLLLDTQNNRAAAMVGYGLEPFVSELTLELCLAAAAPSLNKSLYGAGIGAFIREVERQFIALIQPLERTFGYTEGALWVDGAEDMQDPLAAQVSTEDVY